ncbi:MAG TPA: hypothetical protein VF779_07010 [Pyrinomonadaceae bacterium]
MTTSPTFTTLLSALSATLTTLMPTPATTPSPPALNERGTGRIVQRAGYLHLFV